jgi:hypothetical protein
MAQAELEPAPAEGDRRMRNGLYGLLVALTPLAAQAGEAFSVPSSGVLAPLKPVASLYDNGTMTTGKPVEARGAIETRPVKAAKPAHRPVAVRSSLAPYVRHSKRPAASLPPGVAAPPPYRPSASYAPPAAPLPLPPQQTSSYAAPPATTAPARGFLGSNGSAAAPSSLTSLFNSNGTGTSLGPAADRRFTNRGLFTGSIAQPARPAYPPQQAVPFGQGQPIY